MIGLALDECKRLGINKVLMCCDKNNIGSAKSIINNGGILENEVEENFGTHKIINWVNHFFHRKEKIKTKKTILIMGLKGSRKNIFYN